MKYYKVVAFFGSQPVTSFCIKSDKSKGTISHNLEYYFLKTAWTFLVAPLGHRQSMFINEYENFSDINDYLIECIKIRNEMSRVVKI